MKLYCLCIELLNMKWPTFNEIVNAAIDMGTHIFQSIGDALDNMINGQYNGKKLNSSEVIKAIINLCEHEQFRNQTSGGASSSSGVGASPNSNGELGSPGTNVKPHVESGSLGTIYQPHVEGGPAQGQFGQAYKPPFGVGGSSGGQHGLPGTIYQPHVEGGPSQGQFGSDYKPPFEVEGSSGGQHGWPGTIYQPYVEGEPSQGQFGPAYKPPFGVGGSSGGQHGWPGTIYQPYVEGEPSQGQFGPAYKPPFGVGGSSGGQHGLPGTIYQPHVEGGLGKGLFVPSYGENGATVSLPLPANTNLNQNVVKIGKRPQSPSTGRQDRIIPIRTKVSSSSIAQPEKQVRTDAVTIAQNAYNRKNADESPKQLTVDQESIQMVMNRDDAIKGCVIRKLAEMQ